MKILLFTLEYPPFFGGIANYYGNLVDFWPEREKPLVLHNNENKLINPRLPFFKWLPSIWHLWREVRKEKIDYILVGHILPLGLAVWFLNRFKKIPYTVFLHGLDLSLAQRVSRKAKFAKMILSEAQSIICVNSFTAELTKEFFGGKMDNKIFMVNPGISAPAFKESDLKRESEILREKYQLKERIILLSVGRLVRRKGFDRVIAALPEILKETPALTYVIIGAGPQEEYLREKAKERKLEPGKEIIFLSAVSEEEKWSWLYSADIFIMTSRNLAGDYDGFGIVYLEANLAGKPVIAGKSGGVGDAVEDRVNGLLVNPEEREEIIRAVIKLAQYQGLRQRLGEEGKKRALEKFGWPERAEKIFQIVKTHNA